MTAAEPTGPDTPPAAPESEPDGVCESSRLRAVRRATRVLWVLVALLAAMFLLRAFVLAPYKIPTASMEPTLRGDDARKDVVGDTVLVLKTAYLFWRPQRWDLVAFSSADPAARGAGVVKRVVGLPGETIEVRTDAVTANGTPLELPHELAGLSYQRRGRRALEPLTLGEGEYFVLGDNTFVSEDSRYWGPLDERRIFGKVIAIVHPFDRARWLDGE